MKLKSYLRGIGAGMIVAALIMGVAAPKSGSKADSKDSEPVKNETLLETVSEASGNNTVVSLDTEKAQKEDGDKSQSSTSPDASVSESPVSETSDVKDEGKTEFVDTDTSVSTDNTEPEGPPAINPMPEDETGYVKLGETVEIRVISGDSSVSVSRRIFEAGLVESAVDLDRFLCDNHYDKSICVGTYEIEMGADFETIAKTITRRR